MRGLLGIVIFAIIAAACAPTTTGAPSGAAEQKPVEIRFGRFASVDEPIWLMSLKPELAPNYGKLYTLNLQYLPTPTARLQAYQAGELDGGSITAIQAITAKSENVDLVLVASLFREKTGKFLHAALALTSSGIKTPADLKGKQIGTSAPRTSTEIWVREAARRAGLNSNTDITLVTVPVPTMVEALRAGRVDVVVPFQPWAEEEFAKGGLTRVFTSVSSIDVDDQEAGEIFLRRSFIDKNPAAVRAFLSDYLGATKWYQENRLEAAKLFVQKQFSQGDPAALAKLTDSFRPADGKFERKSLERMQDLMVNFGWITKKVTMDQLLDESYLPK
jgi:ABC-type nitrate/sulfonate/bicarbonate transport system substrate-binding protein